MKPDEDRRWWQRRFPTRQPHRYRLLVDGEEFIPAMLSAIRAARERVLIEMYLVASGNVASRFIEALEQAAGRGVAVYALLDGFGAQGLNAEDRERMVRSGVQLAFYNPLGVRRWRASIFRNHRKLLLVDGRVAFVGGMGLTDDFDPAQREGAGHWHEVMLALDGPCVQDWQSLFVRCWNRWGPVPAISSPVPKWPGPGPDGQVLGHTRAGGQSVMRAVLAAIGRARGRVWIATAYFAPTLRLRRALAKAARRGVDVRLLLAGPCNDHPVVWHAGRRFYGRMLRSGVRVFEYQPRFLHAKMVLCDDWASIGSSNLDRWTLHWNLEANQATTDSGVAAKVARVFRDDFGQSREWTVGEWQARGGWQRLRERVLGAMTERLMQWSYRRALQRAPSSGSPGTETQ